jgi:hypothetical protein
MMFLSQLSADDERVLIPRLKDVYRVNGHKLTTNEEETLVTYVHKWILDLARHGLLLARYGFVWNMAEHLLSEHTSGRVRVEAGENWASRLQ